MILQIEPWIDEAEGRQLARIVETTYVTEGPLTEEFEARIRELSGARHAISYSNGTLAEFGILRALGIGPGDEVIVPGLTFVATCNAVILAGATPVVCDVDRDTLGMDADAAAACITERTRAILPVHLYGGLARVERLVALAREHDIDVVEDAAQGVGVRRRGDRAAGTFGRAGFYSFYGNKTMTTGEGGVILTDDDELAQECFRLKNHGRDVKGIFVHDHIGFNFCFTDLQAAIGLAQLEKLPEIVSRKRAIRDGYRERLAAVQRVSFQEYADDVEPVPWFTNIFVEDAEALAAFLASRKIGSRRFFYPLHLQPCYRNANVRLNACPNSEWLYEHGLSLPSSVTLTDAEQGEIADAITHFHG